MGTFLFRWPYPAHHVYVTGTFDDWGKSERLNKVGDVFEKEVELPSAEEKIYYKFVVDDEWIVDNGAPKEDDGHYNVNNVLLPHQIKTKTTSPTNAQNETRPRGHRVLSTSRSPPGSNSMEGALNEAPSVAAGGEGAPLLTKEQSEANLARWIPHVIPDANRPVTRSLPQGDRTPASKSPDKLTEAPTVSAGGTGAPLLTKEQSEGNLAREIPHVTPDPTRPVTRSLPQGDGATASKPAEKLTEAPTVSAGGTGAPLLSKEQSEGNLTREIPHVTPDPNRSVTRTLPQSEEATTTSDAQPSATQSDSKEAHTGRDAAIGAGIGAAAIGGAAFAASRMGDTKGLREDITGERDSAAPQSSGLGLGSSASGVAESAYSDSSSLRENIAQPQTTAPTDTEELRENITGEQNSTAPASSGLGLGTAASGIPQAAYTDSSSLRENISQPQTAPPTDSKALRENITGEKNSTAPAPSGLGLGTAASGVPESAYTDSSNLRQNIMQPTAAEVEEQDNEIPGAFPQTPENEPESFGVAPLPATGHKDIQSSVTTSKEDYENAGGEGTAGGPVSTQPINADIGESATTSKEDYDKVGGQGTDDQQVSVNPLPATGHDNIQDTVTTSKEDYDKIGGKDADDQQVSVNPLPATGHDNIQDTVTTSKEDYEKVGGQGADDQQVSVNPLPATGHDNIKDTVTTSKEDYEKAGALGLAGVAITGAGAAMGGAFSRPKQGDKNIIPESSLPMDAEKMDTTDRGPFINSAGPGTTTADLASKVPLEPKREAQVIDPSGPEAPAISKEASATPFISSSGPGTTTADLASKVPLEPKRDAQVLDPSTPETSAASQEGAMPFISSSGPGTTTAALASQVPLEAKRDAQVIEPSAPEAPITSREAGATPFITSSGPGTTTADLASQVPLEQKRQGVIIDDDRTAAAVPATVQESFADAHQSPEAATSSEAVAEKSAVEKELLQMVPKSEATGEPASAATMADEKIATAVPSTVQQSFVNAHQSPEAATSSEAVAEKLAVEQELLQKVPESGASGEPASAAVAQSSYSPEAAVSPETIAEKSVLEQELLQKVPESQATGEPASAAKAQMSYYGLATSVPEPVESSIAQAHASPEAATEPSVVAEKSAMERELQAKVPLEESAGEPAPTVSAATATTAPDATTASPSAATTAATLTDGKTGNEAVPDTDTSTQNRGLLAGEIAGGAVVGGAAAMGAASLAARHRDPDVEPPRVDDSLKPAVRSEAAPASQADTEQALPPTAGIGQASPQPGVNPMAGAILSDGTEDPTISDEPSAPKAKAPAETSEATATEYAPPRASGMAPGVSPAAAAALSDGCEDPTLQETPGLEDEPAVRMMAQNESAAVATASGMEPNQGRSLIYDAVTGDQPSTTTAGLPAVIGSSQPTFFAHDAVTDDTPATTATTIPALTEGKEATLLAGDSAVMEDTPAITTAGIPVLTEEKSISPLADTGAVTRETPIATTTGTPALAEDKGISPIADTGAVSEDKPAATTAGASTMAGDKLATTTGTTSTATDNMKATQDKPSSSPARDPSPMTRPAGEASTASKTPETPKKAAGGSAAVGTASASTSSTPAKSATGSTPTGDEKKKKKKRNRLSQIFKKIFD